jgi:hypothetical protein
MKLGGGRANERFPRPPKNEETQGEERKNYGGGNSFRVLGEVAKARETNVYGVDVDGGDGVGHARRRCQLPDQGFFSAGGNSLLGP